MESNYWAQGFDLSYKALHKAPLCRKLKEDVQKY